MQILSNALPGFRDLRGPLIAGYMWLFFAWLLVTPNLDVRPDDRVGGAIYDLAHHMGRLGIAFAISVVAYLLGAVSQQVTDSIDRAARGGEPFGFFLGTRFGRIGRIDFGGVEVTLAASDRGIQDSTESRVDTDEMRRGLFETTYIRLGQRGWNVVNRAFEALDNPNADLSTEDINEGVGRLRDHLRRAAAEAEAEVNLPATLLVGDRPELFAEVDRLRSESELRLTVWLPLLALTILLAVIHNPYIALLGLAVGALVVQGRQRGAEARRTIKDAIENDKVQSPALNRLEEWMNVFPQELAQIRRGEGHKNIPG